MKKFYGLSLIAAFIVVSTIQAGFISCSKDKDTVIVTPADTTVTTQILTSSPWKIEEVRGVIGNTALYYKRGGASNTQSFDNEFITFKADKTGTYTDNAGGQSSLTWDFTDASNTVLTVTINFPDGVINLTWDHLCYKNKSVKYEEYYTNKGLNSHSYAVRMPK